MRKKKANTARVLSVVLSLLMVLSVISIPSFKAKAAGTVDDFVERCYTVTLDRGSDPDGFADWKGQLLNGKSVGTNIAYGFLFSAEYKNKNKSDEDYVKDLYMLFMGREADEGGFNDWVGKLKEGKSREEVFAGFANSKEFYNLCEEYGITAGYYAPGFDRNQVNNVNLFVERLYQTCLGRRGDRDGQKDWVSKLLNKQITGIECARSFVQSKEYINKNLSDEDYVENMYKAMMGRASDEGGKTNWVNALASGKTRDEVFAGFANSKEFGDICAAYKIEKGSYTAKDVSNNNSTNNNSNSSHQMVVGNTLFEDLEKYGYTYDYGDKTYSVYENNNGAEFEFPAYVKNYKDYGNTKFEAYDYYITLLGVKDYDESDGFYYDTELYNDISDEWEYAYADRIDDYGTFQEYEIWLFAFNKKNNDMVILICRPKEDSFEEDFDDFIQTIKYMHPNN